MTQLWRSQVPNITLRKFQLLVLLGSLALLILVIQLVTGIFLTMNYKPVGRRAFSSIEHIMRDVDAAGSSGTCHSTGASALSSSSTCTCSGAAVRIASQPRELLCIFGVSDPFCC